MQIESVVCVSVCGLQLANIYIISTIYLFIYFH